LLSASQIAGPYGKRHPRPGNEEPCDYRADILEMQKIHDWRQSLKVQVSRCDPKVGNSGQRTKQESQPVVNPYGVSIFDHAYDMIGELTRKFTASPHLNIAHHLTPALRPCIRRIRKRGTSNCDSDTLPGTSCKLYDIFPVSLKKHMPYEHILMGSCLYSGYQDQTGRGGSRRRSSYCRGRRRAGSGIIDRERSPRKNRPTSQREEGSRPYCRRRSCPNR
jgi:hypothetical protein